MYGKMKEFLSKELENIREAGLYKNERVITTPQRADIKVNAGENVLNFCANNYLGLSDNSRLIEKAITEVLQQLDPHSSYLSAEEMVGKKVIVVTNLKPAKLCGIVSEGMILCAEDAAGNLSLLSPEKEMESGSGIY